MDARWIPTLPAMRITGSEKAEPSPDEVKCLNFVTCSGAGRIIIQAAASIKVSSPPIRSSCAQSDFSRIQSEIIGMSMASVCHMRIEFLSWVTSDNATVVLSIFCRQ